MQEKITVSNFASLPPGCHKDSQAAGLYIRVREGMATTFMLRYQRDGTRKSVSLGRYPLITLREARSTAILLMQGLARGIDPVSRWKEMTTLPANKVEKKVPTFSEILQPALNDITMVKRWKNVQSEKAWRHTLVDFAEPTLGGMPVNEIGREDILRVLRPIWETKTDTASRLCGRLETVLNWCKAKGYIEGENPARWHGNISLFLPAASAIREVRSHPAPRIDDVPNVFEKMWVAEGRIGPMAVLFGALTATRVGEFIAARWDEINFDDMIWTVPKERRKDRKPYPHRVPLNKFSIAVLERIPRISSYIFPGEVGKHASIATPITCLHAAGFDFTMHGFRSTFRDWAAINEKDFIASEKCLMHSVGNKVTAAYLRTDMLEPRRPIMTEWGQYCFSKVDLG